MGALAVATGAWLFGPARVPERVLCAAAGLLLLYLEPFWVGVGVAVLVAGVVVHLIGIRVAGGTTSDAAVARDVATDTPANPGRPADEANKPD